MALVDLPDVNVWVALSAPEHTHHVRARHYWTDESQATIAFTAQTMLGLVRVCSDVALLDGHPLSVTESWSIYLQWRTDEAVTYWNEPEGCARILSRWVIDGHVGPKTWSDAYIGAFAAAGEMRLVTFDRDFKRFPDVDVLVLQP